MSLSQLIVWASPSVKIFAADNGYRWIACTMYNSCCRQRLPIDHFQKKMLGRAMHIDGHSSQTRYSFSRLAVKGFPSGYSKSVCARPPALGKLRTYTVAFSNDAWRTPPDATILPMASSHHFTHPQQGWARLAPSLWWCAVPLVLPLRAHPLCYPKIGLVVI